MTDSIDTQALALEARFCVFICGYEGVEEVLGPFTRVDAIERTVFLKQNAPEINEDYESAYEKACDMGFWTTFKPDQVCLQVRGYKTDHMKCACRLLPKEWRNEKTWLM